MGGNNTTETAETEAQETLYLQVLSFSFARQTLPEHPERPLSTRNKQSKMNDIHRMQAGANAASESSLVTGCKVLPCSQEYTYLPCLSLQTALL